MVGYHGILLLAVGKLHEGGTYLDAIVAGVRWLSVITLWGQVSSHYIHKVG